MNKFETIKREPLLSEENYNSSLASKIKNYINISLSDILAETPRSRAHEESISWSWSYKSLEHLIQRYSGGEDFESLSAYAETAFHEFHRHKTDFPEFSLKLWEPDAYQYVMWLLSLAVLFDMPIRVEQIADYISLDPDDGQDSLIRQLFVRVGVNLPGEELIHLKPYAELQAALATSGDEQHQLMGRYLKHWYRNMKGCYWHERDKRPDAGFFGYWAFEAAMVTVLWNIDDTVYRDLPYYPKDLVDYARAKHVADHFPQGRPIGAPGMTAKSGEECPCTGVWTCDDWAVGPQTFSRGITLPTDSGRQVTWRLTKAI
ncbi:PoNi-like cognate immunity protein [Pseudomonas fontis]|uniref:PoNi-like cognate immunity protein n=1 Tax=Pseudomonas fontis TaxID=2942633 RepID=A0ABT5NTU6_9PSED|nr:PoNi-like cognate immunity protein [Pseudomonas fontis]MDD0976098.1 PoNi-like cognate immunity protein [Pseudomonas fontis]MDD0991548.1 PoNi-like cognate immunity protein [Pseudomonas fontis]